MTNVRPLVRKVVSLAVLTAVAVLQAQAQSIQVERSDAENHPQSTQEQAPQAGQDQQNPQNAADEVLRRFEAEEVILARSAMPKRNNTSWTKFKDSNTDGWNWVRTQCVDPNSDACAYASIVQVNAVCSDSAAWFKKDNKTWRWIGFTLVMSSAVLTGLGASTTIAGAKVLSTLGGTTGLGAVSATVTANQSSDTSGLGAVASAISAFQKYVQSGGTNNAAPSNIAIFRSAPSYATQCTSAAGAANGNAK